MFQQVLIEWETKTWHQFGKIVLKILLLLLISINNWYDFCIYFNNGKFYRKIYKKGKNDSTNNLIENRNLKTYIIIVR